LLIHFTTPVRWHDCCLLVMNINPFFLMSLIKANYLLVTTVKAVFNGCNIISSSSMAPSELIVASESTTPVPSS